MKRIITLLLATVLFCGALTACGGNSSVTGTWTISNYEYDGVTYKASQIDELCEMFGFSILTWSKASLKFTSGGNVYLEREEDGEMIEIKGTYTVGDTFIELVSDDGEKELLGFDGNKIYFDIPSYMTLVFEK